MSLKALAPKTYTYRCQLTENVNTIDKEASIILLIEIYFHKKIFLK